MSLKFYNCIVVLPRGSSTHGSHLGCLHSAEPDLLLHDGHHRSSRPCSASRATTPSAEAPPARHYCPRMFLYCYGCNTRPDEYHPAWLRGNSSNPVAMCSRVHATCKQLPCKHRRDHPPVHDNNSTRCWQAITTEYTRQHHGSRCQAALN